MGLKRKITRDLMEWRGRENRKSLLVRGARQVGKTHSIREFAEANYDNVVYIDFVGNESACSLFEGDVDVDSIILRISAKYPDMNLDPYRTVIILDEIQECPHARSALKKFSEDPRYDAIASGSLPGIRLADVPSIPVGQVERMTMHPMDFEEFLWALGVDDRVVSHVRKCIREGTSIGESVHQSLMTYLNWYILVGGMPAVVEAFVNERRFDGVRRLQSDIIQDYEDDISKHCDPDQKLRVEMCFRSLSRHLAKDNKRFVASDVEELGYRPSLARYEYAVNWLYQAGIVNECRRVTDPNMPAEESAVAEDSDDDDEEDPGTFKLYINDTGLLAYLYDPSIYEQVLAGNIRVNRGALTENLVAGMLTSQDRKLLYYEIPKTIELDFILVIRGKATAVEVKSGRKRSSRSLHKAMDRFNMDGIMLDTLDIHTDDTGVRHFPIYAAAFLDEIDPPMTVSVDFGSVSELNSLFD